MPVIKPNDLIEVTWEDACSSHEWRSPESAEEWHKADLICRSVGWVIAYDKKGITVAQTKSQLNVGAIWFIPKGMIRKIRKLN